MNCIFKNNYYEFSIPEVEKIDLMLPSITIEFDLDKIPEESKKTFIVGWLREFSIGIWPRKHNLEAERISLTIYENNVIIHQFERLMNVDCQLQMEDKKFGLSKLELMIQ